MKKSMSIGKMILYAILILYAVVTLIPFYGRSLPLLKH